MIELLIGHHFEDKKNHSRYLRVFNDRDVSNQFSMVVSKLLGINDMTNLQSLYALIAKELMGRADEILNNIFKSQIQIK